MHATSRIILYAVPLVAACWAGTIHGQTNSLIVGNGTGMAGTSGNVVTVSLTNQDVVAGLAVVLAYDPAVLTPAAVKPALRTTGQSGLGFNVPTPGELIITLFDLQGAAIDPGSGEVALIHFDVLPAAVAGTTQLAVAEELTAGTSYQRIPLALQSGSFTVRENLLARPGSLVSQLEGGKVKLQWTGPALGRTGQAFGALAARKIRLSGTVNHGQQPGQGVKIPVLAGTQIISEVEPNNTPAQAQVLTGDTLLVVSGNAQVSDAGSLVFDEDDLEDLFKITTTTAGLEIILDQFSSDCDLCLLTTEGLPLTWSADIGAEGSEEIAEEDLPAGSYLIGVTIYDPDHLGPNQTPYRLTVRGHFGGGTPGAGVQAYNIYRSDVPGARARGSRIGNVTAPTTTYTDEHPGPGNRYYQVTALFPEGESLPSNEVMLLVTGLPDESGREIPSTFVLMQNYPNPFNPSTVIRYGLPGRARVTLTVFTVLGQVVRSEVREGQEAGYYEVIFDARGLASGVYFYRLAAGVSGRKSTFRGDAQADRPAMSAMKPDVRLGFTPKDLALALSIEAAELNEAFLWKKPEDGNKKEVAPRRRGRTSQHLRRGCS